MILEVERSRKASVLGELQQRIEPRLVGGVDDDYLACVRFQIDADLATFAGLLCKGGPGGLWGDRFAIFEFGLDLVVGAVEGDVVCVGKRDARPVEKLSRIFRARPLAAPVDVIAAPAPSPLGKTR